MTTAVIEHPQWRGIPRDYQKRAAAVWAFEHGPILPWSWIDTRCGTRCLSPECMVVTTPTRIAYPAGVCVYCGMPAGTRDHLLPEPFTGETQRRLVATVPACAECNSAINDLPSASVSLRREAAHSWLAHRHRKIMALPDKTEGDLAELGPGLRSVAVKNNNLRASVRQRLAWPIDPDYDLRAFQHSGIEDPAAKGLL